MSKADESKADELLVTLDDSLSIDEDDLMMILEKAKGESMKQFMDQIEAAQAGATLELQELVEGSPLLIAIYAMDWSGDVPTDQDREFVLE